MAKSPLYVSGLIFGVIALLHIYRYFYPFNVIIGSTEIPTWVNLVAALATGALSCWMFASTKCCK